MEVGWDWATVKLSPRPQMGVSVQNQQVAFVNRSGDLRRHRESGPRGRLSAPRPACQKRQQQDDPGRKQNGQRSSHLRIVLAS
jgi:hypothetical protein